MVAEQTENISYKKIDSSYESCQGSSINHFSPGFLVLSGDFKKEIGRDIIFQDYRGYTFSCVDSSGHPDGTPSNVRCRVDSFEDAVSLVELINRALASKGYMISPLK